MAIEKKEIQYAKELDDVMSLVVNLVADIKAKKDVSAIASENLPLLVKAIEGINAIPQEYAGDKKAFFETVGIGLGGLVGVLIP